MTTIHKRGSLHEKSARWSHCESLLDDEPDGNDRGKLVAQPLIDYRLYSNMVAQKRVHWKKSLKKLFSLVSFFNVHGSEVLGGKMREPKSIGMKSEKEMSTVIHKTFVRWIEHNEALWIFMNQAMLTCTGENLHWLLTIIILRPQNNLTWKFICFICLQVYSLQLTISDQFGIWLIHHTLNRQNLICFKFGNWIEVWSLQWP